MKFKSSTSNLYVNSEPLLIASTSGNNIIPIFNSSGFIISSGININDILNNTLINIDDANKLLKSNDDTTLNWGTRNFFNSSNQLTGDWEIGALYNQGGNISLDWEGHIMNDYSGTPSLDANNRGLYDNNSNFSIQWDSRILYDNNLNTNSLDWQSRILYDSSAGSSIDWRNRYLTLHNGQIIIDWDNALMYDKLGVDSLDFNTRTLYNQDGETIANWKNDAFIINANAVSGSNAVLRFNNVNTTINLEQVISSAWTEHIYAGQQETNYITFKNSSTGYAVGVNEMDITYDGGITWNSQVTFGGTVRIHSVHFVDNNNGVAICDDNSFVPIIYKTSDGGANWSTNYSVSGVNFTIPTSTIPHYIFDNSNYYLFGVVASAGSGARMVKSINGGANWTVVSNDLFSNIYIPIVNYFFDLNTGFVAGFSTNFDGVVAKTTDGGSTWVYTSISSLQIINGITFKDNLNGYVVGTTQSSEGAIVHTSDGGVTWDTPIIIPNTTNIRSIEFIDNNNGFISGVYNGYGIIYNTTDGGATWNLLYTTPDYANFRNIAVVDNKHIYVVGTTGSNTGILTYTNTGGLSTNKLKITDNNAEGILTNLADPVELSDAANKAYVDSKIGNYLPLTGGIVDGEFGLKSGAYNGIFELDTLSNNRTYSFPNKTGDVALLSDVQDALDSNIQSVTVSQLQNLISTGGIKITKKYLITNPQDGGQIVVDGNSTSGVNPLATWYYTSNHKAFGLFRLSAGSTGAVSVLTVNGTSIISSSISYATSLTQTITNVVANINGYASTSGYRAYAVNDVCVIEYQTATTAINGATVAVTTTGTLTTSNIANMRKGINPTTHRLSIIYSAANDRIVQCQDDNVNIMKASIPNINTNGNSITRFRWNDPSYKRNTFDDVNFLPCFIEDTNFGFSANYFDKDSQCQYNIAINTSYMYGNKIGAGGTFMNNYSLSTGNISYNVCVNQTFNNVNPKYGINNNSVLSTQSILSNTLLGYANYIDNNVLLTGTSRIQFNTLAGGNATIYNNQLNSTATSIQYNNLNAYGTNINNNILSNSNCYIRYNTLNSVNNAISSNTISGGSSEIQYNTLSGANATISSNTISGGSSFIRYNNLIGGNTNINSNTMNQSATIIENNTLSAQGAAISSWTPVATAKTYSNIDWASNNTISLVFNSATLNGTTNLGLAGSPINIGYIPATKAYPIAATFEASGLTSSSSGTTIQVLAETDTSLVMTPALTLANANNINTVASFTSNKTTAVHRKVQAIPSGGNISAGSFQLYLTVNISRY